MLERRPPLVSQDSILVYARDRVAARIEAVVDRLGIENDNIIRKSRIERTMQLRCVKWTRQRERGDLTARMHARIGAARSSNAHGSRENPLQRGLDARLNRI